MDAGLGKIQRRRWARSAFLIRSSSNIWYVPLSDEILLVHITFNKLRVLNICIEQSFNHFDLSAELLIKGGMLIGKF